MAQAVPGARPLHRPLAARAAFALALAALGVLSRLALGLSVPGRLFGLLAGWMAAAILFYRAGPGEDAPFGVRFAFLALEVVLLAAVGRVLGASTWLVLLFLLGPLLEWNLLHPGRRGLAGTGVVLAALGALVASEALGFVPGGAMFPGVDPALASPAYAVAAFGVASLVVLGMAALVGRYAQAGRARRDDLEEANRSLEDLTAELEASRRATREAYDRLEGAQADAVNTAKMAALGHLVAGVAHEINTPMGALNSNHDVIRRALDKLQVILEDERVDEDELEEVRRIVKAVGGVQATNAMAVDRMSHIVKSLRTFGRPDRSEIGPFDLAEGLESTLTILSHEVRGRIEVKREFGRVPPVRCYPNRVNQVFMNLLMNACQAIPDQGTITVRTGLTEDGAGARVQVSDTGVGIAPEALEKIFEPGFTTKGTRVGMGMGLLITRQIVEQHSGRIEVDSAPGQGTTFTVTLPLELTEPDDDPRA